FQEPLVAQEHLAAVIRAIFEEHPPTLENVKTRVQEQCESAWAYNRVMRVLAGIHSRKAIVNGFEKNSEDLIASFNKSREKAESGASGADYLKLSPAAYCCVEALEKTRFKTQIHDDLERFYRRVKKGKDRRDGNKESEFLEALTDWLRSGDCSREHWELVRTWNKEGGSLAAFKEITWENVDPGLQQLIEIAATIDFEKWKTATVPQLVRSFCEQSRTIAESGRVEVHGKTVFLSDVIDWINEQSNPREVAIRASDCVGIDVDLTGASWSGVNLSIVSRRMTVWKQDAVIDLSGISFAVPEKPRIAERATRGRGGEAGGSSGNVCIRVDEIVHPEWLRIVLNGGNGEDGEAGGDGVDGEDGRGITTGELQSFNKYDFLHFKSWDFFKNEITNNAHEIIKDVFDREKKYLYYEIKDEHNRRVIYSLSGEEKYVLFRSYDLVVLYKGAPGKPGTAGEQGGLGGQGGYAGSCELGGRLYHREHKAIRVDKAQGRRGADAVNGRAGRPGKNGNDMAIVDQSLFGENLIIGKDEEIKLEWEYSSEPAKGMYYLAHLKHDLNYKNCYGSLQKSSCILDNIYSKELELEARSRHAAVARATIQASQEIEAYNKLFSHQHTSQQNAAKKSVSSSAKEEQQRGVQRSDSELTTVFHSDPEFRKLSSVSEDESGKIDLNYFVSTAKTKAHRDFLYHWLDWSEETSSMAEISSLSASWPKANYDKLLEELKKGTKIDELWKEIQLERTMVELLDGIEVHSGDKDNVIKQLRRIAAVRHFHDMVEKNSRKFKITEALDKFEKVLKRTKGIALRDAQKLTILAAIELDNHHLLQQVATGEGKSYIIAGIAAIRCLLDNDAYVDVVTVSSVLAERDANELVDIFSGLGITSAHNCDEVLELRERAYKARIVYGDLAHFQRDYLIHTYYRKNILGERKHDFVIVDEVDNMLLDNGNNVLYLTHSVPSLSTLDELLITIYQMVVEKQQLEQLQNTSAIDCEDIRIMLMTDLFGRVTIGSLGAHFENAEEVFRKFVEQGIIDKDGFLMIRSHSQVNSDYITVVEADLLRVQLQRERQLPVIPLQLRDFVRRHLLLLIKNCARALAMEPDEDYVIDTAKARHGMELEYNITIIDRNTGADLVSSQWAGGLHQFLQLRHGCRLSPLNVKAIFISNVTYFKQYKHIDGLSGTLGSSDERNALRNLYAANLISIPTHLPKRLVEWDPIVTTSQDSWADAIYASIAALVHCGRSVLVICDSIQQLQLLESKLRKKPSDGTVRMQECLKTMSIYKRQQDDFKFEDRDNALSSCQLLLATNLAGRGTNIHLSDDLIEHGGLHVIVAFAPRNLRIEEQAFGRASRAGRPGSAQLIVHDPQRFDLQRHCKRQLCMVQLKRERDNAEVRRLGQLHRHYEHHTNLEEACLRRFLAHAADGVVSAEDSIDSMPNAAHTIYRAILDEWALWLDEKETDIESCSRITEPEELDNRKQMIIDSVEDFINSHPISSMEKMPTWIRAEEKKLSFGIVYMLLNDHAAKAVLDQVIKEGGDSVCTAFAYYYLGCIQLPILSSPPTRYVCTDIYAQERAIEDASFMLQQARAILETTLRRKSSQTEALLGNSIFINGNNGLKSQVRGTTKAYSCIISNIDWLLGYPLTPDKFTEEFGTEDGYTLQASLARLGLVASAKLSYHSHLLPHHLTNLRNDFGLSPRHSKTLLQTLHKDNRLDLPLSRRVLEHIISLPSRSLFWREMQRRSAFLDTVFIVVTADTYNIRDRVEPLQLSPSSSYVRYSNMSTSDVLYLKDDVLRVLGPSQLAERLENGCLQLDALAQVDVSKLRTLDTLDYFDHFTRCELEDFCCIQEETAVMLLRGMGNVLRSELSELLRLHADWRNMLSKVEKTDWARTHAHFSKIESYQRREYVTALLGRIDSCQPVRPAVAEQLIGPDMSAMLIDIGILESCKEDVYQLKPGSDWMQLPPIVSSTLQAFLFTRFAHRHALDALITACEIDDGSQIDIQVLLPLDPYGNLLEELIRIGLAYPSQFAINNALLKEDLDFDDFTYVDSSQLDRFITERRRKLHYDSNLFEINPFTSYLSQLNATSHTELRTLIDLGMRVAIQRKERRNVLAFMGGFISSAIGFIGDVVYATPIVGVAKLISKALDITLLAVPRAAIGKATKQFHNTSKKVARILSNVSSLMQKITQPLNDAIGWSVEKTVLLLARNLNGHLRGAMDSVLYYYQLRVRTAKELSFDVTSQHRAMLTYNQIASYGQDLQQYENQQKSKLRDDVNALRKEIKKTIESAIRSTGAFISSCPLKEPSASIMDRLTMDKWFLSEVALLIENKALEARLLLKKSPITPAQGNLLNFPCDPDTLICGMKESYIALIEELQDELDRATVTANEEIVEEFMMTTFDDTIKTAVDKQIAADFIAQLEPLITEAGFDEDVETDEGFILPEFIADASEKIKRRLQQDIFPIEPTKRDFLFGETYRLAKCVEYSIPVIEKQQIKDIKDNRQLWLVICFLSTLLIGILSAIIIPLIFPSCGKTH
ncbi:hypothetical protein PENTCL1PPCAC_4026, partial [Pristionchus entomophagus]